MYAPFPTTFPIGGGRSAYSSYCEDLFTVCAGLPFLEARLLIFSALLIISVNL